MRQVLATLAAFVSAGLRPRTPLARAIAIALALKLTAVVAMKVFWFSGDSRPLVDDSVMARVIGPDVSAPQIRSAPLPAAPASSAIPDRARSPAVEPAARTASPVE